MPMRFGRSRRHESRLRWTLPKHPECRLPPRIRQPPENDPERQNRKRFQLELRQDKAKALIVCSSSLVVPLKATSARLLALANPLRRPQPANAPVSSARDRLLAGKPACSQKRESAQRAGPKGAVSATVHTFAGSHPDENGQQRRDRPEGRRPRCNAQTIDSHALSLSKPSKNAS